MGYISEDYCSEELSGMLMEKGYMGAINTYLGKDDINVEQITIQSAMKWLREIHNIFICISFRFSRNADNDINFSYYAEKYENHYGYGDGEFLSYEEACKAAIKYCLKNLI